MAADTYDADDLVRMRSLLIGMTGYFKDVMENGMPKPPPKRAGVDAKSADMEWHECRWHEIREAESFLAETESAAERATNESMKSFRKPSPRMDQ
jgi:hypothetical protein